MYNQLVSGHEKVARGNCSGVGIVSVVGMALFLGDDDDNDDVEAANSSKVYPE